MQALDRRRFLSGVWKVFAGALGIEAVWMSRDLLRPLAGRGSGGRLRAGAASEIREGSVTYLREGRLYLVRVNGELLALSQRCSHLGCRVPYCESSARFECPCHGSVFNRKGEYVAGPAPRGLDSYPVAVERGEVIVDTGALRTGPSRGVRTLHDEPAGPSCLSAGAP